MSERWATLRSEKEVGIELVRFKLLTLARYTEARNWVIGPLRHLRRRSIAFDCHEDVAHGQGTCGGSHCWLWY